MNDLNNKSTKLYPITGVGIGPGDPELITVKGLKALQKADVIFYPASALGEKAEKSFSRKIIQAYNLTGKLKPLLFPMTGLNRQEFYQEAFKSVLEAFYAGFKVVVVSEGDLLFYSTFGYLLELANEHHIPCELIPGIPAFILGGATSHAPLVDGEQSFGILARPESFDQLEEKLQNTDVLVVMKPSVLKNWGTFLKHCNRPFFYAEKLGTEEQFVSSNHEDISQRTVPYFSIIIFRK